MREKISTHEMQNLILLHIQLYKSVKYMFCLIKWLKLVNKERIEFVWILEHLLKNK